MTAPRSESDEHAATATLPPALGTPVPGPQSRALAERLARVESRNVTALVTIRLVSQSHEYYHSTAVS